MEMLLVRTVLRGRSFGDLPHIRICICAQSLQILLIGVIKDPVVRKTDYGEKCLLKLAIPQHPSDIYLYQLKHSGYKETRTECCNVLQNISGKPWIGQYILAKVS